MPYQYYCPCAQRRLLEGHEGTAGQQVQCPYCPQIFVQPAPPQPSGVFQAPAPAPAPAPNQPRAAGSGIFPPGHPAGGGSSIMKAPGQIPGPMPGPMPGQMPGPMPGQMPNTLPPGGSSIMSRPPTGGSGVMQRPPGGSGVMQRPPTGSSIMGRPGMAPVPGPQPGGMGSSVFSAGGAPGTIAGMPPGAMMPGMPGNSGVMPGGPIPGMGMPGAPMPGGGSSIYQSGAPGLPGFGGPDPNIDPLVHVVCPCPKRQVMPTPKSMLGQDALCPYCNVAIKLRNEDTQEFKRERDEYLRKKEEKFAKKALNWAIAAAILVGLGLITMIVILAIG